MEMSYGYLFIILLGYFDKWFDFGLIMHVTLARDRCLDMDELVYV